jgi:hypothetical protein
LIYGCRLSIFTRIWPQRKPQVRRGMPEASLETASD